MHQASRSVSKMSADRYEVRIVDAISSNLGFRDHASDFINALEDREETSIIVDFTGVTTISRGFAHEYQMKKGRSSKAITEINIPDNVREMFIAAMDYRKGPRFPEMDKMTFTPI